MKTQLLHIETQIVSQQSKEQKKVPVEDQGHNGLTYASAENIGLVARIRQHGQAELHYIYGHANRFLHLDIPGRVGVAERVTSKELHFTYTI